MGFGDKETTSAFGSVVDCTSVDGGVRADTTIDAHIELHIHIHSDNASLIDKTMRCLDGIFGKRIRTIEGADKTTQEQLQGDILRQIENR